MTGHQTLLAYGIVEYQSVIDHLNALRTTGVSVPHITLTRLTVEQHRLMRRWLWDHGDPKFKRERAPEVHAEALTYCREHMDEVESLLEKEKESE
jgi:hypothetical protein